MQTTVAPAQAPVPRPRSPGVDLETPVPRHWFGGNVVATHVANGVNLLFPAGERFFVRSVNHYQDQVTDPLLRAQIKGFFAQEGRHAREHERVFRLLEEQGYEVARFLRLYERVAYGVIEELAPPALRLATTAACEHYTAILAENALAHRLLDLAHPSIRALLLWHASEEIEHRAVAFDVLQQVSPSYPLRVAGLAMATACLGGFWIAATLMLLRQEDAPFARLRSDWRASASASASAPSSSAASASTCAPTSTPRRAPPTGSPPRTLPASASPERTFDERRAPRHRRHRLRRPRHGHPPQAGGHPRLHHPRAGRRRRRHLARQPLPGRACDVESHLYSFSFEPNPDWSRAFAPQGEILAYLERCADKYGLRPHIRFDTAVTGASFDERSGLWTVETTRGPLTREGRRLRVRRAQPALAPGHPGARVLRRARRSTRRAGTTPTRSRARPSASSAPGPAPSRSCPRWRRGWAGSTSSSARRRGSSPSATAPSPLTSASGFRRAPLLQRLDALPAVLVPRALRPRLHRRAAHPPLRREARAPLPAQSVVRDPALRERLTPHYTMGCKRILLSNDYYPALQRPNVELVTEGIRAVTPARHRHRRRQRAPARRARAGHRLPGRRGGRALPRARAGRAGSRRGLARRRRGLPRDDDHRLPQPVPPRRAQHRPRATARWSS